MATRPPILPVFCTANPSNMADLPQSLVETGYVANEPMPVEYYNRLANNVGTWVQYLDESSATTALFQDTAISARMVSQAIWSWTLSSRTLSWDNSVYIAFPSAPDANNTIAAGSVTLNSGDCAYVQTNTPFQTYGSTSSGSPVLTGVVYADEIQAGWVATGAGIPSGTTVSSVSSDGSTVTLSGNATATASNVSLVFAGSGTLTVQTTPMASLTLSSGTAIIARATDQTVYVGVGSGQMRLHDGEQKGLLESGYGDIRRLLAGGTLAQNAFVYVSPGTSDSRTAGSVYPADATAALRSAVLGVNVTAHSVGDTAQIVTAGLVTGFSSLTTGAIYYLDPANVGGMTATKPTSAGQYVVPVGIAVSSSALLINSAAAALAQQISNSLEVKGNLLVDGSSTFTGSLSGPTVNNTVQPITVTSSINSPFGYGAALNFPYVNATNITASNLVQGANFVSANGFKESVFLGGYSTTNFAGGSQQLLMDYGGSQQARRTTLPYAGSIKAISLSYSNATSTVVAITVVKNGSNFFTVNLQQNSNNTGAYANFSKGQYPFTAGDVLSGLINWGAPGVNTSAQVELKVESAS